MRLLSGTSRLNPQSQGRKALPGGGWGGSGPWRPRATRSGNLGSPTSFMHRLPLQVGKNLGSGDLQRSGPWNPCRPEPGGPGPGWLSPYTGRVFQGARASRSERSWGSAGKAEWRSWQPMKRTMSATESSSRKKRSR